jgi:hypothetical protein
MKFKVYLFEVRNRETGSKSVIRRESNVKFCASPFTFNAFAILESNFDGKFIYFELKNQDFSFQTQLSVVTLIVYKCL